ncbi:MAG: hypothetical protein JXM70_18460 [Pirellulales bacterium]|nr:hypothetical protein [Pirellulales bacterium]
MTQHPLRGTWGTRQLVRLFTLVLAVLFFWLLGFVVEDIESISGPDYSAIEQKHVNADLVENRSQVADRIEELDREISNRRDQQQLVGDSSQSLQRTINQLIELQKLSVEKAVNLSASDKDNLSTSLKQFLESQKTYQELNQSLTELTSKKVSAEAEMTRIEQELTKQRNPAQREFEEQTEVHRLRLAFFQLAILLPVLAAATYLLTRWRGSIYYPLFLAVGGATLLKIALVVHEYFPTRYFKYMLIVALLAVVVRLLIYLIRSIAFPKTESLNRQYREAYERFLCPICEYPIRTGPRRFLYWTRRTVHKIFPQGDSSVADEPYTCPSCGTNLLNVCDSCQKIRHTLLPCCEHCGARHKPV